MTFAIRPLFLRSGRDPAPLLPPCHLPDAEEEHTKQASRILLIQCSVGYGQTQEPATSCQQGHKDPKGVAQTGIICLFWTLPACDLSPLHTLICLIQKRLGLSSCHIKKKSSDRKPNPSPWIQLGCFAFNVSLSENDHLYKGCLSQPGTVKVHDKNQPSSLLSHPLFLPPSPWESGGSETLSPSLLSLKGGLNSKDLSAETGFFL